MNLNKKESLYEHFSTTNTDMEDAIDSFIREGSITLFDWRLFCHLSAIMDYKNKIKIKYLVLSDRYSIHERNIRKSFKRLSDTGFIRKVKNTRPPVYMINPIYSFKGTKENHQKLFDEFYGL